MRPVCAARGVLRSSLPPCWPPLPLRSRCEALRRSPAACPGAARGLRPVRRLGTALGLGADGSLGLGVPGAGIFALKAGRLFGEIGLHRGEVIGLPAAVLVAGVAVGNAAMAQDDPGAAGDR